MIGTAIMGALVTLGLTRLRDDYLAIVTLGFAEAMRIVAENEIWLTKGTDGISGIPQPLKSDARRGFQCGLSRVLPRRSRDRAVRPGARALLAVRPRAARDPRGCASRRLRRQGCPEVQGESLRNRRRARGPRRRALRALFELHRAGNLRAAADDLHLPRAHRRRHRQQLGRGDRRIRRGVLP